MASLPHETTVTKACHPYFTVTTLAAYDEARRIFERLINAGRKDLEDELAMEVR